MFILNYEICIASCTCINNTQITKFMGPPWCHLGPVGPRWAHDGPMNLAIRAWKLKSNKETNRSICDSARDQRHRTTETTRQNKRIITTTAITITIIIMIMITITMTIIIIVIIIVIIIIIMIIMIIMMIMMMMMMLMMITMRKLTDGWLSEITKPTMFDT